MKTNALPEAEKDFSPSASNGKYAMMTIAFGGGGGSGGVVQEDTGDTTRPFLRKAVAPGIHIYSTDRLLKPKVFFETPCLILGEF